MSSNTRTPTKINMDTIEKAWSPLAEGKKRDDHDKTTKSKLKIRSLNGNTRLLRGGDWLVTPDYVHMTLAVAWEDEHRGKKYGLTVYRPYGKHARTVQDSVFALDSDEPEEIIRDGHIQVAHRTIKVGTVVSVDVATDSLIFEICPHINIDPLAVALSDGDNHVRKIVLPKAYQAANSETVLPYYKKVMMFGAARRGMIGRRVVAGADRPLGSTDFSAMFGAKSYETTITGLTYGGNCGALHLDEDGIAWCMHTAIEGIPKEDPKFWTSRGSLLQQIVNAHCAYFGHTPLLSDSSSLSASSSFEHQSSPRTAIQLTKIHGSAAQEYPPVYFESEDSFFELQPALPRGVIPVVLPHELIASEKEHAGE